MKHMYIEPPPQHDPAIALELEEGRIFRINYVPEPIRSELVKRWNAFDELLAFVKSRNDKQALALRAKYEAPGTED